MLRTFVYMMIVALIGFAGCKSVEKSSDVVEVGNKKTNYIVEQVQLNDSKHPKTLSFKANSELKTEDKSTSFKATVRVTVDSAIWISITAYSYEVARILATPDTLKFVSRTEKNYYIGGYAYLTSKLGVDFSFYDLQSLLLANSFGLDEIEDIRRSNSKRSYVLSSVKQGELKRIEQGKVDLGKEIEMVFTNWINPKTYQVEMIEILDLSTQKKASIQYSSFENIDDYMILSAFKMNIFTGKNSSITSEFSKIEINQALNFPFKISSKYEQIH